MKTVPAHVPDHLVVDIDFLNIPDSGDDPQSAWKQFRGKGPLVWSPYNGGHWVVTEGDDIGKIWRDTKRFSSKRIIIPDLGYETLLPIEADPPVHAQYRRNIQTHLDRANINDMMPDIRALAVELIDGLYAKGECDFISEFAEPLPLTIFMKLVGLPLDDRPFLHHLVDVLARSSDNDERIKASGELHAYLETWIEKRVAEPGDDLFSSLTTAEIDGRLYNRAELMGTAFLLTIAGLDTVASLLGFVAWFLAKNPDARDYIINNNEQMPNIVQELIRRFPVSNMGRVVIGDFDYRDVALRDGDRLLLVPSLYNLDEKINPNPEKVDFEREGRHVTFGTGAHTCAGAVLARAELSIFLEEWLKRIPDFQIKPGEPVLAKAAPVNAVQKLVLSWTPVA